MLSKHLPSLLSHKGCKISEFKSPMQIMFSHNTNASSNTLDSSQVNVLLSKDGGLYALTNVKCR